MHTCIYEDENTLNFEPFTFARPVYNLVCGITTLKEKIQREFPGSTIGLHCRKYLESQVKAENPGIAVNELESDECLFISGRILASENLKSLIRAGKGEDKVFTSNGAVIAAKVSGNNLKNVKSDIDSVIESKMFDGIPMEEVDIRVVDYIWELVHLNGDEIRKDFDILQKKNEKFRAQDYSKYKSVSLIYPERIFLSQGVIIKPGVVLDASDGPIYIDKDVEIFPNAVIKGSCFIGASTKIKSGATIYENVSVGEVCKIGGEVEESIFHSYSNKQHSGYLGHSYIGSWVNIGADTNCSDLQNNYGSIKVQVNGRHIDSGKQFVGLMMGDHSKTAINTMFNTGSVVGFSCNVYGAGFPPKYIPSFSWGGSEAMREYKFSKAIETAKAVLGRRNKEFNPEDEKLFEDIFTLTKPEREKRGI